MYGLKIKTTLIYPLICLSLFIALLLMHGLFASAPPYVALSVIVLSFEDD